MRLFKSLFGLSSNRALEAAAPEACTFADLTPETLSRYITGHRARDGLWIFQHIPKTAGSSLANEIARNRKPYRNINVAKQPKDRTQQENIQAATEDFLSSFKNRKFRSCSGHLRRPNIDRIREAHPDARLCTFVRHPVARLISDYRYTRTPAHPRWEQVIRDVPNFEHYLKLNFSHNKMTFFMLGRNDLPADEAIDMALQRFDFIGVQELYGLSFTLLSTLMWEAQAPAIRKRITQATPDNDVEMTDALSDRILSQNQLDLAVYEAVKARLQALDGLLPQAPRAEASEKGRRKRPRNKDIAALS